MRPKNHCQSLVSNEMSSKVCENANCPLESYSIAFIDENFHMTSNLRHALVYLQTLRVKHHTMIIYNQIN